MPRPAWLAARKRAATAATSDARGTGSPGSTYPWSAVVNRAFLALAVHERARLLLIVVFGISGVMAFSWLARIPSIRDELSLTPAELGLILLVGSIGALVTVFSAPALLARFGSARVFAIGALVNMSGFILIGAGTAIGSRWVFGLAIVINGIGGSLLTVPMNVESARIEQAYGRSVIPHFHAAFSAGAVGGSILGAVASSAGVPVWLQFAVVAVVVGGLRLMALRAGLVIPGALPGRGRREAASTPGALSVWREPRAILIGVLAFAAAISEGAANNWLSLAFVDGFATTEAFGGLVLGVFIGTMTIVRVFGSRAIDGLGRVASLQLSVVLAIAGIAAFGLSGSPQVALIGVALWGGGTALCFPLAVAAASDEPVGAQARVSMMASLASVAVMTAAPLIGVVASSFGGPQHALLIVVVPLVAGLLVAGRVAPLLAPVADPLLILAERPEPVPAA
ncbi:MAG TPA: MFS transporter [Propionicimonas sp.]|uniref:MFS transporter n=1 Tax=Propionicimonas sp. TaxID=1955623 RepID=UPI002F3F1336